MSLGTAMKAILPGSPGLVLAAALALLPANQGDDEPSQSLLLSLCQSGRQQEQHPLFLRPDSKIGDRARPLPARQVSDHGLADSKSCCQRAALRLGGRAVEAASGETRKPVLAYRCSRPWVEGIFSEPGVATPRAAAAHGTSPARRDLRAGLAGQAVLRPAGIEPMPPPGAS
jgi:hypothetical protein